MFIKRLLVVGLLLSNILLSGCYPFFPNLPVSQPPPKNTRTVESTAPLERSDEIKPTQVDGWETFTKNHGVLGNDNVQAIAQDEQGNLWFGTFRGGVSCFDGKDWKIFDVKDGLVNNNVHAISVDADGNIWFGTDGGASSYDGQHWFTYKTQDGLVGNVIQFIFKDDKNNLWFSTNTGPRNNRAPIHFGVFRFDGSSWINFTRQSTLGGLASDMVNAIEQDRQGNLWFGTNLGISRYDGRNWQTYTKIDGLADNNILSMEHDIQGNIWVGTPGSGISRFDGNKWETFTKNDGLGDNYIMSICADKNGSMWFSTSKGASRYDGTTWRTFTRQDGLADEQIHCIFQDKDGDIWFGTYTDGVSRYETK
jgi:streptogramin lyase